MFMSKISAVGSAGKKAVNELQQAAGSILGKNATPAPKIFHCQYDPRGLKPFTGFSNETRATFPQLPPPKPIMIQSDFEPEGLTRVTFSKAEQLKPQNGASLDVKA